MSGFLQFVNKNKLEKSWFSRLGTFLYKAHIQCIVKLLDGTELSFELQRNSYGSLLYEKVFYHLDLIEIDYFGLQFIDNYNFKNWIDPTKKLKKQLNHKYIDGPPYIFHLKVKFYTSEPSTLHEELTRYQYFLQLKQDILNGKLEVPYETSIELAALALQAELGDFEENEHSLELISEFRFIENQTEQIEMDILEKYKLMKGQTPAQAEMNYLNKCKWLELYGVDMHTVIGRDNNLYTLGLTPTGILIFEGKEKMGLFYWPKITRLDFKKNKILLYMLEDDDTGTEREVSFVFRTESERSCKHLWKCAVEHHCFFRLKSQSSVRQSRQLLIRMVSKFRYSGRTEFQTSSLNRARRSVTFERKPSQRFSRRNNFTIDSVPWFLHKKLRESDETMTTASVRLERMMKTSLSSPNDTKDPSIFCPYSSNNESDYLNTSFDTAMINMPTFIYKEVMLNQNNEGNKATEL